MPELRPLGPELWVIDHKQRVFGAQLGSRSTLARLEDGALWLHSPGPLSDALVAEIEALGAVEHLVAPNINHHLHLAAAAARWPAARVWLAPGLDAKHPGLSREPALSSRAPDPWRHQLDQELIGGTPDWGELSFFHRRSKTLILTDLAVNVRGGVSWWTGLALRWMGLFGKLAIPAGVTRRFEDHALVRQSADRILQWDFQRVVMAHGQILDEGARMAMAELLASL